MSGVKISKQIVTWMAAPQHDMLAMHWQVTSSLNI